jgi:AcrR family transcriptional regulator
MKENKRARSADDKAEKYGTILAAAGELILERDYRELTMADIAAKAKVAKGTLFLYFKSKEELFLALTAGYFRTFFADLESAISSATGLAGKAEKARAILSAMTRHIGDDPGFLKMIVLLGPIIEKNVAYENILEMKRFMLERMKSLGASLEEALPGMGKGAGMAFLMRVYGIAVGYLNLANPASCAKQVIENEELAAFRFDFRREFEETAAILLEGMQ